MLENHPKLMLMDQGKLQHIYGLAGSATVALLILSTINNPKLAALYLFYLSLWGSNRDDDNHH